MKKINIFYILLFTFGIMSCAMHNQKNSENTGVSFYLVKNKISDADILKNNLSRVVLDKSPVFTTKDIIEYSQGEHSIKLTEEAYKIISALNFGDCFAICVDNKPVYLGRIRRPTYWSAVLYGVVADREDNNEVLISFEDPSEAAFLGEPYERVLRDIDDPRQNKLILDSLRRSNKLVETLSEQKAMEIAMELFPELKIGPIEQYKFIVKRGDKSWSIFYTGTGKYNWVTNHGAIIVNKKTGKTKHVPGMKL